MTPHRGEPRTEEGRQSAFGPTTDSGSAAADASERLFRAEYAPMVRLAALLRAADPEDVAAEAFRRLHLRWAELDNPARAGGYLRTTVVNLCRSRARHEIVVDAHASAEVPAAPVTSAEEAVLQAWSRDALIAALARLTPRHREALVLRYWADMSEAQMAAAMGCSAGSVKSHVSRGLSALREALHRKGEM